MAFLLNYVTFACSILPFAVAKLSPDSFATESFTRYIFDIMLYVKIVFRVVYCWLWVKELLCMSQSLSYNTQT